MITYGCPKCNTAINSPESEVGKQLQCPQCKTTVVVPAGQRPRVGLIVGTLSTLMIVLVGFPLLVIACVLTVSVLGQKSSGTFTSVGQTIGGS